jgi:hypothetical protein
MHSSANSDHSPCGSKTKLFHVEFSDLHVSEEDSIEPWCDQLECQFFEAEYLADEDSVFVPADVAAIVHPSQKETLTCRKRMTKLARYARLDQQIGCIKAMTPSKDGVIAFTELLIVIF